MIIYIVIGVLYLYGVLGVLSCFVFRSFFFFFSGDHFLEKDPSLCCSFLFRCFFSVNVNFMLLFVIFKRLHFDTQPQSRRHHHRPFVVIAVFQVNSVLTCAGVRMLK